MDSEGAVRQGHPDHALIPGVAHGHVRQIVLEDAGGLLPVTGLAQYTRTRDTHAVTRTGSAEVELVGDRIGVMRSGISAGEVSFHHRCG